jgi:hypothetical protein
MKKVIKNGIKMANYIGIMIYQQYYVQMDIKNGINMVKYIVIMIAMAAP